MTREEAIDEIKYIIYATNQRLSEALEIAIKDMENISHLTDRPCSVCEFKKENGCCKWTCVFCDELFGGMK